MKKIGEITQNYDLSPPDDSGGGEQEYEIGDDVVERMYSTVYHGLTRKHNLSSIESLLIATIYPLSKTKGYSDISQASLKKILNSNMTTINQTLQEIERKGLIERAEGLGKGGLVRWKLSGALMGELQYIKDKISSVQRRKHM